MRRTPCLSRRPQLAPRGIRQVCGALPLSLWYLRPDGTLCTCSQESSTGGGIGVLIVLVLMSPMMLRASFRAWYMRSISSRRWACSADSSISVFWSPQEYRFASSSEWIKSLVCKQAQRGNQFPPPSPKHSVLSPPLLPFKLPSVFLHSFSPSFSPVLPPHLHRPRRDKYIVNHEVHDCLRHEVSDGFVDNCHVGIHQVPDRFHLSLQLRVHGVHETV